MFRRTTDQENFFKKLEQKETNVFTIKFDSWYFCFLLGIFNGKKEPVSNGVDLIPYFPGKYAQMENVLISMLIRYELADKGISASERAAVQNVVDELIDPFVRPPLTGYGFKLFNEYSAGGFEIIYEGFDGHRPNEAAPFLIQYGELLKEAAGKR